MNVKLRLIDMLTIDFDFLQFIIVCVDSNNFSNRINIPLDF